jgi:ATP-dependent Clp protease ATP-binding subunit ClpB
MRLDKLTIKLQEALQEAINLAQERNHQQVDVEHLIYTLLRQQESMLLSILDKLGIA